MTPADNPNEAAINAGPGRLLAIAIAPPIPVESPAASVSANANKIVEVSYIVSRKSVTD